METESIVATLADVTKKYAAITALREVRKRMGRVDPLCLSLLIAGQS
jgi:hypothetical protein